MQFSKCSLIKLWVAISESREKDKMEIIDVLETVKILEKFKDELIEFRNKFHSETACIEALEQWKWPNGYKCPKCRHNQKYDHKNRNLYQCINCKHQTSLTAGTIFHKTRTPLKVWFFMIFLMGLTGNKLPRSLLIQHRTMEMGNSVSYKAINSMGKKIYTELKRSDKYLKLVELH